MGDHSKHQENLGNHWGSLWKPTLKYTVKSRRNGQISRFIWSSKIKSRR
jgi:hypothetical protein